MDAQTSLTVLELAIGMWVLATLVGSAVGILAMLEIRRNRKAVLKAVQRHLPYSGLLNEIVRGNIRQQWMRLLMEGTCWICGLLAFFGDASWRGPIIAWLLVAYRLMHTINSATEYRTNVRRREKRGE